MMGIVTREQMRIDVCLSLDIALEKLYKIIDPVNFTYAGTGHKLSRYKVDRDWIFNGGVPKIVKALKDVMHAVQYLRDINPNHTH